MSTILIVLNVAHEGLGTFDPVFRRAKCAVQAFRAFDAKGVWPTMETFDGLVLLGGPQSVYEQKRFPYLARELTLIEQALKTKKPVLGVCLGSQLLAAALGATVAPNETKEIGWYPLMRELGADGDPLCEPFGQTETVFQWHGDTFTLPKGATQLFSSPLCDQQAFRYGGNAYGLQFHVEVTEPMIRAWLSANASELAKLRGQIDPVVIKSQIAQHLSRLQALSEHVAGTFTQCVTRSSTDPRRMSHARG